MSISQLDVQQNQKLYRENHYPDFSQFGYGVIRKLGCNQAGGRTIYLADDLKSQRKVVIKEFSLASNIFDWSGVRVYERERDILQKLNHPRIPCYLGSFETATSFCLVQEYKSASCLGISRNFQPGEIKKIALSILEILVYLQQQNTPIIHLDIKPDNILVDENLNAYLVDFGLARTKNERKSFSTLVAGTPGFVPPEEYSGDLLTEASDLYSLGVTLICLLTQTRSADIHQLMDDGRHFLWKNLLTPISHDLRLWLRKMVAPSRKRRYVNAKAALKALESIQLIGQGQQRGNFSTVSERNRLITMVGWGTVSALAVIATNVLMLQPEDRIFLEVQIDQELELMPVTANSKLE
ncbi:serine/threonine protein kinase [Richelia sinica FACHB-800]|uniref:non-specific serine/threonine protein kinase n=1 Tax=Richelia sinica FACHB-800 TaxID=1357546 RepID=A0A975T8A7_9NOST|nr:serine/threonine-protein kinase [Richelia sinica]MBD2665191.1 serine/threonine protein kinase [Richelia sinica FACHB-800]QXE23750.1 serine/threonine protein kinase [Richelia sinica FACHB-800]